MTRKDLTSILHKSLGLSLKESARIVDKFFDIIVLEILFVVLEFKNFTISSQ